MDVLDRAGDDMWGICFLSEVEVVCVPCVVCGLVTVCHVTPETIHLLGSELRFELGNLLGVLCVLLGDVLVLTVVDV